MGRRQVERKSCLCHLSYCIHCRGYQIAVVGTEVVVAADDAPPSSSGADVVVCAGVVLDVEVIVELRCS